ncbi:hypothetical protein OGAPHI_000627 [Ogataea philodendri]|uniref:[acyl-carrier-protein] S-malonyltransferase n=1 Tax=Ogataea philodendri TaxID=1378263 RepID=A0A9P8PFE4_9ASCO|nr:uncharacterized protein OGAPHI_000627 [Ogataea philodendri]KAH3670916.1 hypothetical protein OGAPHI_000627 [Ogataea philodendri]
MSKVLRRLASTKVVVFPGQGRFDLRSLSKLAEHKENPVVKTILREADETLPTLQLSKFITDPQAALRTNTTQSTSVQQPLLILTSFLAYNLLKSEKNINLLDGTQFLLGHSLGEISAMVVQDAVPFSAGLELAHTRGLLMEKTVAKTGNSYSTQALLFEPTHYKYIDNLLAQVDIQIGNYNNYQQIVVSGVRSQLLDKIDQMRMKLVKAGIWKTRIRNLDLRVSIPFHNPLLREIEPDLEEIFERSCICSDLKVPVLSNLNGEIVKDANEQAKNIVQVTSRPVQFVKCLEKLSELDTDLEFVSFGAIPLKIIDQFFHDLKRLKSINIAHSGRTVDQLFNDP